MELTLKRIAFKSEYTIGKLYIDGIYFCDTLEDYDRGLSSDIDLDVIKEVKISGKTAIPYGIYDISLNVISSKYKDREPYKTTCSGKVPRLLNVPGFDGILIHIGNGPGDTSGCILVGENKAVGKVINSTATWKKFYDKLLVNKGIITINIIK